jgi:serine/threonine-protein kinase
MNKKIFFAFTFVIILLGPPALSACISDSNALAGGAGLSDENTLTPETSPTSEETSTPVPTETPIPTPTLGVGSTRIASDGMTMVYVPAGEFTMGRSANESLTECQRYETECTLDLFTDEEPPHTVFLDAFWMDQTEVTNAMYAKCVAADACKPLDYMNSFSRSNYYDNPEFNDYPVVFINWDAATAYCTWAGRRLPTEAEWEKAARGPATDAENTHTFSWGDNISCNEANYYDFYNGDRYCVGDTSKVGSYESGKSPYGAYDLTGNVMEWVRDLYSPTYYQRSPSSNPLGAESGDYHLLRGGSWYSYIHEVRTTERLEVPSFFTNHYVGFRCAGSP